MEVNSKVSTFSVYFTVVLTKRILG